MFLFFPSDSVFIFRVFITTVTTDASFFLSLALLYCLSFFLSRNWSFVRAFPPLLILFTTAFYKTFNLRIYSVFRLSILEAFILFLKNILLGETTDRNLNFRKHCYPLKYNMVGSSHCIILRSIAHKYIKMLIIVIIIIEQSENSLPHCMYMKYVYLVDRYDSNQRQIRHQKIRYPPDQRTHSSKHQKHYNLKQKHNHIRLPRTSDANQTRIRLLSLRPAFLFILIR